MGVEPEGRGRPFLARRLAHDAEFLARVEAADRLGIAPSRLDGREPESTTRHYYDRRNRLVRSVTTRESEWTEQDRAEVLALALYRSQLCPLHGGLLEECTSPEETGPQYEADRKVCRAQLALLEAQKAAETQDVLGQARVWHIRKRG